MRTLLVILFAALTLLACAQAGKGYEMRPPTNGETDWCTYTWTKDARRADIIVIKEVADWRWLPDGFNGCAPTEKTTGCFTDDFDWKTGKKTTTIWLNAQTMIVGGQCDTLQHEMAHALGYRHNGQTHISAPKDHTRR